MKSPQERAEALAREKHAGQTYDGLEYADAHLAEVVQVLYDFGFASYASQGWLHDIVEDTDVTVDELRAEFGDEAAEDVWAVTGVGETRKIRNASIYAKITARPRAAVLKCADRIVNVRKSAPVSSYRAMYAREQGDFEAVVRPHVPAEMWDALVRAFDEGS